MEAEILGKFIEGTSTCYLSSVRLEDYITSLPDNYKDYEVQREIVNNAYLDTLINTITAGKHIPPIVLVVEADEYTVQEKNLQIKAFKILDGLQRTFRLKVIYDTIKLLKEALKESDGILNLSKLYIAKNYKVKLEEINSSTSILAKLIEYYKSGDDDQILDNLFSRIQWFEIWMNLNPDEEVTKMLILNAGHKAVKTKHQLELLFKNILPLLQKVNLPKFTVIREKEASSFKLVKDRQPGQYLFSYLITSLLSFSEGKPLTTNVDLIQKSQNEQYSDQIFDDLLKLDFLKEFLRSLINFDENLFKTFGAIGTQWLGRETCLVGIFAAVGKYAKIHEIASLEALNIFNTKIVADVNILRLNDFEIARNSLNLAKINFGLVNKRAVFNSVFDILEGEQFQVNWGNYFNSETK